MLKICLCSDNHGDIYSLEKIKQDNPACDYYFHLGDSHFDEAALSPFISVAGNNDWEYNFPKQRIVEIENHRILMLHGDGYTYNFDNLIYKAKQEECDVVFFGHTHIYFDEEIDGVRCINPGSCFHNRDYSNPCYALVNIDNNGKITSKRIDI